jgi:hypothetical protein
MLKILASQLTASGRPVFELRLPSGGPDDGLDDLRNFLGVLVCPESEDSPTFFREPAGGLLIADAIVAEFRHPIVGVRLRTGLPVFWATVPKASIDEDRDSLT